MSDATPLLVDARGLRCPWPALRLARAMRDLPAGGVALLQADDPAAAREVAALAAEQGWRLTAQGTSAWRVEHPQGWHLPAV